MGGVEEECDERDSKVWVVWRKSVARGMHMYGVRIRTILYAVSQVFITALIWASRKGDTEVVKALLAARADKGGEKGQVCRCGVFFVLTGFDTRRGV